MYLMRCLLFVIDTFRFGREAVQQRVHASAPGGLVSEEIDAYLRGCLAALQLQGAMLRRTKDEVGRRQTASSPPPCCWTTLASGGTNGLTGLRHVQGDAGPPLDGPGGNRQGRPARRQAGRRAGTRRRSSRHPT